MIRVLSVLAGLSLLAACSTQPATAPLPPEFEGAASTALVAGRSLSLESYLWRDFAPISPPDGRAMIAVVRVHAAGGAVPAGVRAEQLWVVNGDEVWSTPLVEEQPRGEMGGVLAVVARGGPKWSPGTTVDLFVRLRDGQGRSILLLLEDQPIHRTD